MYPPETSLIPATVALSRFLEAEGLRAFFSNYPYWYLGSTPYRYLTGPVVPLLTVGIHKLLRSISLFDITILLIIVTYVLSAVGWTLLVNKITKGKLLFTVYYLLFTILLIFPWRLFSSLTGGEASFTLARNFLPWALLAFWALLRTKAKETYLYAAGSLSLLLLINTSILPIFLVGLSSQVLAACFKKGKIVRIGQRIKPVLFLIPTSLFLVTLWYTPSYWWTILANPSIGGVSGVKVIFRILDLLKASVPLVLAIIAVYFSGRIKSRLTVFSLTWTFTFLFLTVFRFIGDWDFWMDWSSWFGELEIGLAMMTILLYGYIVKKEINKQYNSKTIKQFLLMILILVSPYYLVWRVHKALGRQPLISREIPEGVSSLEKLAQIAGKENVFLSGSTVFWVNALYDIYQVRGGRDQVARHPYWDKAAYELREGHDPEAAEGWLRELDVSFVLVHGPDSSEYYHDFKFIYKWGEVGERVWENQGDVIYETKVKKLEG